MISIVACSFLTLFYGVESMLYEDVCKNSWDEEISMQCSDVSLCQEGMLDCIKRTCVDRHGHSVEYIGSLTSNSEKPASVRIHVKIYINCSLCGERIRFVFTGATKGTLDLKFISENISSEYYNVRFCQDQGNNTRKGYHCIEFLNLPYSGVAEFNGTTITTDFPDDVEDPLDITEPPPNSCMTLRFLLATPNGPISASKSCLMANGIIVAMVLVTVILTLIMKEDFR